MVLQTSDSTDVKSIMISSTTAAKWYLWLFHWIKRRCWLPCTLPSSSWKIPLLLQFVLHTIKLWHIFRMCFWFIEIACTQCSLFLPVLLCLVLSPYLEDLLHLNLVLYLPGCFNTYHVFQHTSSSPSCKKMTDRKEVMATRSCHLDLVRNLSAWDMASLCARSSD